MMPEVMSRVFEPFFSTKEQGKGTGLGLSMVFGFMKQSGGHVSVYSEPGRGTTVRLYLPYRHLDSSPDVLPPRSIRGGHETILLVEDDESMRRITVKQLRDLGYHVIEAGTGDSAAALIDQIGSLDLILTDIVMPGSIDGIELARRAAQQRPDLGILLMSGFSAGRFSDQLPEGFARRLISKPFDRQQLGAAVRDALDSRGIGRESGVKRENADLA